MHARRADSIKPNSANPDWLLTLDRAIDATKNAQALIKNAESIKARTKATPVDPITIIARVNG
jgi:hypothetical protein